MKHKDTFLYLYVSKKFIILSDYFPKLLDTNEIMGEFEEMLSLIF